jgi:simple sugar transport system ATP-binding protein
VNAEVDRPAPSGEPTLEVRDIVKWFGHVEALRGVSLQVFPGEVVGLVGDNGAGKSTLVGCISGVVRPDAGTLRLGGEEVVLGSPLDAHAHGIETVYQDLALAFDLDPAENIFLGRELAKRSLLGRLDVLDRPAMRQQAREALAGIGITLPSLRRPTSSLSGGQRQAVAIARAVKWARRLIVMDEPTAALGVAQSAIVLDTIRRVRALGTPVVLISHNLHDVFAVTDRIVVLRLGAVAGVFETARTTQDEVVATITGAAVPVRTAPS